MGKLCVILGAGILSGHMRMVPVSPGSSQPPVWLVHLLIHRVSAESLHRAKHLRTR